MLLVRARRSNRAMTNKEIPQDFLNQIVEAAYRAPTASNLQQVRMLLITDKDILHKISSFTIFAFHSVVKLVDNMLGRFIFKKFMPDTYKYLPAFRKMKAEFDKGTDFILRDSTALLLIYTPKNARFGCEDANLAYQNASLMAECLGVSQFYTGFVLSGAKMKKGKLEKLLGIEGKVQAGMALGMPAFRYLKYVDRKN
jgi:nitroreductase